MLIMYRLMIVDDEVEIRNGLALFDWASCGFRVSACLSDGMEALNYVLNHPVDVAICDINMDRMTGLEFAKEIADRKLCLKIVLLTGYKDMNYVSEAMHYGCYDYLLKPTKFSKLYSLFQSLKSILDEEWKDRLARSAEYGQGIENDVIQYAKAYILSHLDTASLDSVSEYLGLSPTYFSRLFKESTGCSFSDYCQNSRISKAMDLLKNPDMSILSVARYVGYTNATNFARAFKCQSGSSPSEYRLRLTLKNDSTS